MGLIHKLEENVIQKIAAGEVVERPASVIKELAENSLDAGATAITVELEEGGLVLLRVTDNGKGIAPEDVPLALERHATSKLQTEEDLNALLTLGFRGEALYSIAAVSRLELCSRTAGQEGTRLHNEGGKTHSGPFGCPDGTSITVRNLFYNTPARRKFLKKPTAETSGALDLLSRLALSRPDVAFTALSNGRIALKTPGDGQLSSAIGALYGLAVVKNMLPVILQTVIDGKPLTVTGYIGNYELEKRNRSAQTLFVNGRYIKNTSLSAAVAAGYQGRLNAGRYPMFILNIALPPEWVDVNVHPQKTEVRFSQQADVPAILCRAVRETLSAHQTAPLWGKGESAFVTHEEIFNQFPPSSAPTVRAFEVYNAEPRVTKIGEGEPFFLSPAITLQNTITPQQPETGQRALPLQQNFSQQEQLHILGQLFCTYIVFERGDEAYILDQHAAHERLLYERMKAEVNTAAVIRQELLMPFMLHVNFAERHTAEELLPALNELGFSCEPFGPDAIAVRAVPSAFAGCNLQTLLEGCLQEGNEARVQKSSELKRERLLQWACKHAVRGGDALSEQEIYELLRLIGEEKTPLSCPHGRPILIRMPKKELEQRFSRSLT